MARFSLIVATINRTAELARLLASIEVQNEVAQVIIVDQNLDNRLKPIVERFASRLDIVHTTSATGAARARNVGLDVADGDIVAFPDDDAWYPAGLLTSVAKQFESNSQYAGLSVRCADENGLDAGIRWLRRPVVLNRFNIWRSCIESGVFVRRGAVSELRFNADLGQGSGTPWGSGEIADFVLRIIDGGHKFKYEPDLIIHHRSNAMEIVPEEKALRYARGIGMVMRLNGYGVGLAMFFCLKPLVRAVARASRLDFAGALLAQKVATHRWNGYRGIA